MRNEIFTIQQENQLDEMQEQTLRKIEGRGFWLMWGGLLAAWIVQTMFGAADKAAGEWVVFMIGCIYMCVACLRQWFVGSSPFGYGPGQCRVFSGCCGGGYADQRVFSSGYWVGAAFAGVFAGILCFALLQLCVALVRKRREHLDDPKDGE